MGYRKLLVIIPFLFSAYTASADKIYFRDGRAYECKVTNYSRDSIEVEFINPLTSLWVPKYRVFKIQYDNGFTEFYGRDAIEYIRPKEEKPDTITISEMLERYNLIAEEQAHNLRRIARIQENFWILAELNFVIGIVAAIVALVTVVSAD